MIVAGYILFAIYLFLILYMAWGIKKLPKFDPLSYTKTHRFSILVPFRNESENLPLLINSFKQLDYPKALFEIIFIDDYSTDNSAEIINKYMQHSPNIRLVKSTKTYGSPKKHAITIGIKNSENNWIITTDADCTVPKNWLSLFSTFITERKTNFIAAPVEYKTKNNFLEKFQYLDFLSLQGVTIGSFGWKKPVLCNGANLCYNKSLFNKLGGFSGNENIVSGDDIFLMEKFLGHQPEKVQFLKQNACTVKTLPMKNLKALFNQRIRWAAKTTAIKNMLSKSIGLLVFLTNLTLIILVFSAIFGGIQIIYLYSFFLIKLIIDTVFLIKVNHFFKKPFSVGWFVLSSICYPFYTVVVVILSLFGSHNWKERKFRK